MMTRGLITPKGELFAYLHGDRLFTLDDEHTGYLRDNAIVDLAGSPIWRLRGDAVFNLDYSETIGYLSTPKGHDPSQ
jgi:hypothetical protein